MQCTDNKYSMHQFFATTQNVSWEDDLFFSRPTCTVYRFCFVLEITLLIINTLIYYNTNCSLFDDLLWIIFGLALNLMAAAFIFLFIMYFVIKIKLNRFVFNFKTSMKIKCLRWSVK